MCDPETLTITIEYERESDDKAYWVARNPDLPGCIADGPSPEEALANLALVRILYLEHLCEEHLSLHEVLTRESEGGCDD